MTKKFSDFDAASAALATHQFIALDPAQADAHKNQRVTGTQVTAMVQAVVSGSSGVQEYAFADLPLTPGLAIVNDSNTAVIGAKIAGGGTNYVLAFGNGLQWVVVSFNQPIFLEALPVPDVVTTGTATGGIWAGTGTITDGGSHVWSIRLADRVVLKDGVAQSFTNVLELWYADATVWAFYGDHWQAIDGASIAARPKMPTTPGLRLGTCGPRALTLPVGCVVINPGDNVQSIVNANPAGTVYGLKKGTYNQQEIIPKNGDQFHGEHDGTDGVILDGQSAVQFAFTINPTGVDYVVLKNLFVVNYTNQVQYCSIWSMGSYTLIQDCDVSLAVGGGIWASSFNTVIRNRIHHNAQIGYKVVRDSTGGTVATGCLFDSNEIDNNDPTAFFYSVGEQGGGKAWDTAHLTFWYNYSHDNVGPGFWTDFDNWNTIYWYNQVDDNAYNGIEHEISWNASIVGNLCQRNGDSTSSGWDFTGSGIDIVNSGGVTTGTYAGWIEIANNTVVASTYGRLITLRDQDRGSSGFLFYSPDPWQAKNVYVHDNSLDSTASTLNPVVGMVRDYDLTNANFYIERNIHFENNAYNMGFNSFWTWNDNPLISFRQWQALGFDTTGTLAPDSDTSASPDWSANHKGVSCLLSNSDLTVTGGSGGGSQNMTGRGTTSNTRIAAGEKKFFRVNVVNNFGVGVGLVNRDFVLGDGTYLGSQTSPDPATDNYFVIYFDGKVYRNRPSSNPLATLAGLNNGDTVDLAVHGGVKVWIAINGVFDGDPVTESGGFSIAGLGDVYPAYNLQPTGELTLDPTYNATMPTGYSLLS